MEVDLESVCDQKLYIGDIGNEETDSGESLK